MPQKVIIMTFGNMRQAKEAARMSLGDALSKFIHLGGWRMVQKVIIMTFGDMRQAWEARKASSTGKSVQVRKPSTLQDNLACPGGLAHASKSHNYDFLGHAPA